MGWDAPSFVDVLSENINEVILKLRYVCVWEMMMKIKDTVVELHIFTLDNSGGEMRDRDHHQASHRIPRLTFLLQQSMPRILLKLNYNRILIYQEMARKYWGTKQFPGSMCVYEELAESYDLV